MVPCSVVHDRSRRRREAVTGVARLLPPPRPRSMLQAGAGDGPWAVTRARSVERSVATMTRRGSILGRVVCGAVCCGGGVVGGSKRDWTR